MCGIANNQIGSPGVASQLHFARGEHLESWALYCCRMTPEMTEQVLGLTVNEVMAYSAAVNVALVFVLVGINAYYAWQANRQANASGAQVAASNRQAEVAQKTLDFLLKERERQREIDVSTVSFQLQAAIHRVDDWTERIASEGYNLPEVIDILPTNFSSSISNAERIDGIVAGYMGASLVYIAEAETDMRVMRERSGANLSSMAEIDLARQNHQRFSGKVAKNLNVARFKLDSARTRLNSIIEGEEHHLAEVENEELTANPST